MPESPTTVAEYRAAHGVEWGTYVATQTIDIGGARAFNVGDPVPVSHVESGVVVAGEVAKVSTSAGREAAGVVSEKKG